MAKSLRRRSTRMGVASLAGLALSFAAAHASAQEDREGVKVELDLTGGYHHFAKDLELGVADDPALPSPKAVCGLRSARRLGAAPAVRHRGGRPSHAHQGQPDGQQRAAQRRAPSAAHQHRAQRGAGADAVHPGRVRRHQRSFQLGRRRVWRHQVGRHRRELLRRDRREVRAVEPSSTSASTGAPSRRRTRRTTVFRRIGRSWRASA